jgi:hypothetical protein
VRDGQEDHRRRSILRERCQLLCSTPMGKSENAMSSVGFEGRGAHEE